jgi:predicted homoserine dehydrogenase-like protein
MAGPWLDEVDAKSDRVWRVLLSTIDGHRNIVELESVARALGLHPEALENLRQRGLIDFGNSPSQ